MSERRRETRHEKSLTFSVRDSADAVVRAETINISSRGLYCTTNHRVPLYSKLRVAMELPMDDGDSEQLDCEGVVVRLEEDGASAGKFSLAIYFLNIDEASAKRLDGYLDSL